MDEPYPVDLTDPEILARTRRGNLQAGGLEIRSEDTPPLFHEVEVRVHLPGSRELTLRGQVVNPLPGGEGFFVHFPPGEDLDRLVDTVDRAIDAGSREEAPGADDDEEPASDGEDGRSPRDGPPPSLASQSSHTPAWELVDKGSDVPLHKQVRDLSMAERLRLARQANRPERRILVHDIDKRVHLAVVKNPRVKDDEIAEYARLSGLSPLALEWIAKQGRYTRRRDILMNLILNPKTPLKTAKRLLDRVSERELVRVLRSPKAKEPIKRQVKRKLMKAGVI